MKKFIVVLAVLAMTMFSTVAMAEITFDGSIEFLMRSVKNTEDWNDATTSPVVWTGVPAGQHPTGGYQDTYRVTYERVRFGVNAKNDTVKGRIQIENDWDVWADNRTASTATAAASNNPGFETRPNNALNFREAWLDFTIPGAGPAHVKVGRQFLQLGNGWWFRSNKYGSDAWVVGRPGQNTIAFVNVKAAENDPYQSDDTDAYVLLDTYKFNDQHTAGIYFARVFDRKGDWAVNSGLAGATEVTLDNIGLHYTGQLGPVKLMAEADFQMGEIKFGPSTKTDLEGTQFVLQATMPIDALTLTATAAMGTGDDSTTATKMEGFLTFMDKDPHYTLVYEYYMKTAAGNRNTSFANTTALGIDGRYKINKMFTVGLAYWMLSADQKDNQNANPGADSDDVGSELDLALFLTITDQLTWNTVYGTFMPGDMYKSAAGKADNATAWHSVLSYKF